MQRIVMTISLALIVFASAPPAAEAATCYGRNPCHACKNCRYCAHCAKQGGTCGVCRIRH